MKEQSLDERVTKLEERIKAMEKTLTTLNPYQKVAPIPSPILESFLHLKTDPSLAQRLEQLKAK